jgi:biotin carboxylase
MTTVLLLGWRQKAIAALRALGAHVTCVVQPGQDAGVAPEARADRTLVVADAGNAEDVLSALARHGLTPADFDVVGSQHEMTMVTAAAIGGDRAWIPLRTALRLRDKVVQKACVRPTGIRVADTQAIDTVDELLAFDEFPRVLKPMAGAGSRNVYVIRGRADAERAVKRITASGRLGPWLVETFVTGREHALDGVVRDGRIRHLGVVRYQANLIDMQIGALMAGIIHDPVRDPGLYRAAYAMAEPVLRALGHRDGVFHMEGFLDDDGFIFSECAGRIGGGMGDLVTLAKFGVDLHDQWARAALSRPAALTVRRDDAAYAHGWLTLPGGRLIAAPGPDLIRQRPGVQVADVKLVSGDPVADPRTTSDAGLGTAMVRGVSEEEAERYFADLVGWVQGETLVDTGSEAA